MSQRDSGYARVERDAYETPQWVTHALLPHIPERVAAIWEPACGSGQMVRPLEASGYYVLGSDINDGCDFLKAELPPGSQWDAVITNPPYNLAEEFIHHALQLMHPNGIVAMLLRTDYDHAKTRQDLFGTRQEFAKKLVLTKRIQWFEHSTSAPSFNHAWFIWDWKHEGPPVLAYGPNDTLI